MLPIVDHLVYAVPDLDAGIDAVEQLLGCGVVAGGRHENWGTRNALISLGDAAYLEIIGPDPDATIDDPVTLFGIDGLDGSRLVTWAAKATDLVDLAAGSGLDLGQVSAGSRSLPDGSVLAWQLTDPFTDRCGGVIPFFIDWGDSPHPAASLPPACRLVDLTLRHPDPTSIEEQLAATGIATTITPAAKAGIAATIHSPNGMVSLS